MTEDKDWASIRDFATLFQYFWYRDFPMDAIQAIGVGRVDWTIHIGVVVRQIAELMGYVTRFEEGGRKDAVLRSTEGDEIDLEWEWKDILGKDNKICINEVKKLKSQRNIWNKQKGSERLLKYAVLVTYTQTAKINEVYQKVAEVWRDEALWPLLLILIDRNEVPKSKYYMGEEFNNIQMSVFFRGEREPIRSAPAFPWNIPGTRWSYQQNSSKTVENSTRGNYHLLGD